MEMAEIQKALFLVVTVNIFSTSRTDEGLSSSDCNCASVGPWRPVFKPSQPAPDGNDVSGYGHSVHGKSLDERDVTREITHVFVPVTKPNAYRLEHKLAEVNQPKYSGYDTSVQDFVSRGKHRLQWDHYGDVGHIHVNNKENVGNDYHGHKPSENDDGGSTNNDTHHSGEHYGNEGGGSEGNEEDDKFFNSDSFFDEHTENPLRDADEFSEEKFHESSPSLEYNKESEQNNEREHDEDFVEEKRPTASSYASISSVYNKYNSKPHPHDHGTSAPEERYPYKSIWTHYKGPAEYLPNTEDNGDYYVDYGANNENGVHSSHVYNNIPPNDPNRPIKQYSVHETPEEDEVEPFDLKKPITLLYSKPVLNEHPFNNFWRKESRSIEDLRPPPPPPFPSMSTSVFYKKYPSIVNDRMFNYKQNVRKPFSYVYVLKTMNTKANKKL